MSPSSSALVAGDPVYHPKYGFGNVHSLTRRDRFQPVHERSSAGIEPEQTEEYYDIHLIEGGSLLVPVGRAESVGLRLLTSGVEAVKAGLRTAPEGLPANFRATTCTRSGSMPALPSNPTRSVCRAGS